MTKKIAIMVLIIILVILIVSLAGFEIYRVNRKEEIVSASPTNTENPYFSVTITIIDTGTVVENAIINGPPVPPTGVERIPVTEPAP
jgi:hypothetical protein